MVLTETLGVGGRPGSCVGEPSIFLKTNTDAL